MKPGPIMPYLDDVVARLNPAAVEEHRRLQAVAGDVDYCPAHWIESQRKG
jgi:hypothetical protein